MFPDGNKLRVEYGKALSCHERALLFAIDAAALEDIKERPEPPGLPPSSHEIEDDFNRCRHITSLYQEAVGFLCQRLSKLSVDYDSSRKKVAEVLKFPFTDKFGGLSQIFSARKRLSGIFSALSAALSTLTSQIPVGESELGERNGECSTLSVDMVSLRAGNLAFSIGKRKETLAPKYKASTLTTLSREDRRCYVADWAGLDKICRLLMEEIAYVRGRNDELKKLFATYRTIKNAILVAILTMMIALGGILISLGGTAVSLIGTAIPNLYHLWKEQSPSPEKKPSPDETAAALTAIAKIPDQLNPLAAINEKLQRPLLVSVSGKLDEKPAQNGDADVLRRVGELETKVQTLENWRNTHDKGPVEPKEPDSPIVISKDLFSDDAPIVRKLGTISDALAKIEVAINKKKFPEIQIPKPAPVEVSIRTIGWSKTGPTPHKSSTP